MKNRYHVFFYLMFIGYLIFGSTNLAQDFYWAKNAGGITEDFGYSISTDANGNSYLVGSFKETASFGTIQLFSYGNSDIFIAKYNKNGNCLWAKKAGGISDDIGRDIFIDANGNIFVTGHFKETVSFGNIQLTSYGDWDIFIAKYDTIGNCIWARAAGTVIEDFGTGISADSDGYSYLTGSFKGIATFGTIQIVGYGGSDVFIAKYDPSGSCVWVKKAGGDSFDEGAGISTDASGNSYITAYYSYTGTFGTIQLVSYGGLDIFLAKYDSTGNCLWAKNAGGTLDDYGFNVSIDTNGNSYITGAFEDEATFGTTQLISYGFSDMFIAKYDSDGNFLWAKNGGGSSFDRGNSISTDLKGNSYVIGNFWETANFGTLELTSIGLYDIFIANYDSSGNCIWVENAGGTFNDFGFGISTSRVGNNYITGCFEDSAAFGAITLNGFGAYDIFIATISSTSSSIEPMSLYLIPSEMQLYQNYPNPFNPSTKIKYSVSSIQKVTLKVYDLLGREVATLVNEEKPAGDYEVEFDISNALGGISAKGGYASGVYFYQLRAGDLIETKKMLLLK